MTMRFRKPKIVQSPLGFRVASDDDEYVATQAEIRAVQLAAAHSLDPPSGRVSEKWVLTDPNGAVLSSYYVGPGAGLAARQDAERRGLSLCRITEIWEDVT